MRHRISGRQLGRSKDERKALFKNLVRELIVGGRVKTTIAKAKAIKPLIDKLVTKAKKTTLAHNRGVYEALPKESALLLINHIAPHFTNRTSGFSRIVRLGERSGDNAHMVILEWADTIEVPKVSKVSKGETKETKQIERVKKKKISKKVGQKRKVVKKT